MARKRSKARGIEVGGLTRKIEEFRALPAATRRAITGAINEQANETRGALTKRIAADGRVRESQVRRRIRITKAGAERDYADLTLSRSPVPFRFWQYDTRPTDDTGTRASIWIRKGGRSMRVWGFVNPRGKKQTPLMRYRKAGRDRLRRANGWSLKNHWNHQVDDQLRDDIRTGLDGKFMTRFDREWRRKR